MNKLMSRACLGNGAPCSLTASCCDWGREQGRNICSALCLGCPTQLARVCKV